jgi:hypothetical protein
MSRATFQKDAQKRPVTPGKGSSSLVQVQPGSQPVLSVVEGQRTPGTAAELQT